MSSKFVGGNTRGIEVLWPESGEFPRPIKKEVVPDKLPPLPAQISGFDASQFYIIKSRPPINFRGAVTESAFNLEITQDVGAEDEPLLRMQRVQAVLSHAFHQVLRRAQTGSIGQVYVENDKLYNKVKPTERKPVEEMSFEDVAKVIVEAEQSPKDGEDGEDSAVRLENTTFTLVTFLPKHKTIIGVIPKGMYARNEVSMFQYMRKSSSLLDPMAKWIHMPKDMKNMCIPMCIMLALKLKELDWKPRDEEDPLRKDKHAEFERYRRSKQLREDAKNLVQEADVEPALGPFKMCQMAKFQQRLGVDYQINVFSAPKQPDHKFGPDAAPHHINLFIREDIVPRPREGQSHAVLICSMQAFFGKQRKYCQVCKKTYARSAAHPCDEAGCRHCKMAECMNKSKEKLVEPFKLCDGCNRTFFTKECYDCHKKKKICEKLVKCKLCREFMEKIRLKEHTCGQRRCGHCKVRHLPTEFCYLRPDAGKNSPNHPENVTKVYEEQEEDKEEEEEEEGEEEREEEVIREQTGGKKKKIELVIWYADAETQVDPRHSGT